MINILRGLLHPTGTVSFNLIFVKILRHYQNFGKYLRRVELRCDCFVSPRPQHERLEILQALTRHMVLAADVHLPALAQHCQHFTGADFKALLYNAQLQAIHELTGHLIEGATRQAKDAGKYTFHRGRFQGFFTTPLSRLDMAFEIFINTLTKMENCPYEFLSAPGCIKH